MVRYCCVTCVCVLGRVFVFLQAEDGIRYLVRSGGLGDVYKRQVGIVNVTHFETCTLTA